MPEILEIEIYRRFAQRTVGRTITRVDAPDSWYLKGCSAQEVSDATAGAAITAARRKGKLLLLDLDGGRPTLGLRFGMTGRLIVDEDAAIEVLEYSSDRNDPAWDRFVLSFAEGMLTMRDPRRLGGVELDPDESLLGTDAWELDEESLEAALAGGKGALKARLLDQKRIAGLGNLLADEVLWRSGLDPTRSAGMLSSAEISELSATVRDVLDQLDGRGGSHRGDLHDERCTGGVCPLDGVDLKREKVGGRTTYWCPEHQR